MPSDWLRGLARICSGPPSLKLSAVAGRPSVTRFTHSSCTGDSAAGRPPAAAAKIATTSPMFELTCAHSLPHSHLACSHAACYASPA